MNDELYKKSYQIEHEKLGENTLTCEIEFLGDKYTASINIEFESENFARFCQKNHHGTVGIIVPSHNSNFAGDNEEALFKNTYTDESKSIKYKYCQLETTGTESLAEFQRKLDAVTDAVIEFLAEKTNKYKLALEEFNAI